MHPLSLDTAATASHPSAPSLFKSFSSVILLIQQRHDITNFPQPGSHSSGHCSVAGLKLTHYPLMEPRQLWRGLRGYGPGTWVTFWPGDMGDTSLTMGGSGRP
jgi:hypothetical protein